LSQMVLVGISRLAYPMAAFPAQMAAAAMVAIRILPPGALRLGHASAMTRMHAKAASAAESA